MKPFIIDRMCLIFEILDHQEFKTLEYNIIATQTEFIEMKNHHAVKTVKLSGMESDDSSQSATGSCRGRQLLVGFQEARRAEKEQVKKKQRECLPRGPSGAVKRA